MSTEAAMPPPAVLGLTAAVLALHLWLLDRGTPPLQPAAAIRTVTFITRGIAAPPPPAEVATAAPAAKARPMSPGPARPGARIPTAAPATAPAATVAPAGAQLAAAPSAPPHEPVPPASARVIIPDSVLLRYQFSAFAKQQTRHGMSELEWRHDGASYEARFEVATTSWPTRAQHSAGRVGAGGLEPSRFGDRSRAEQAAHFDRETQRVVFSNNRPAAPLAPGAQDRLSVLLQLASLVAGDPERFSAGTAVVIQTATTHDAQAWFFTVDGEERLQLPGGEVATLKPPARRRANSTSAWRSGWLPDRLTSRCACV